jgi:hypothetical protein
MADQVWRSKFFDVQHWYVMSSAVPESGPLDKATRDAMLQHILGMSFMTSGPKEPINRVVGPLAAQRLEFHLLVKDLSRRPSPRHRQKALDSSLKQMENKVRT